MTYIKTKIKTVSNWCTASLITDEHLLTAGHCYCRTEIVNCTTAEKVKSTEGAKQFEFFFKKKFNICNNTMQGSVKIVRPYKIDSPSDSWWNKEFIGGQIEVNKTGTDFYEVKMAEVHKDFAKDSSGDTTDVRKEIRKVSNRICFTCGVVIKYQALFSYYSTGTLPWLLWPKRSKFQHQ